MEKTIVGAKAFLYPMPITLVGANVSGKPNYLTVAYCCMVNRDPPIILASLNKNHYTNIGIKENGTFSVNIPSVEMVEITDYCGTVSGHKVDKSRLFKTFYGKLETAPMIKECLIKNTFEVCDNCNSKIDTYLRINLPTIIFYSITPVILFRPLSFFWHRSRLYQLCFPSFRQSVPA